LHDVLLFGVESALVLDEFDFVKLIRIDKEQSGSFAVIPGAEHSVVFENSVNVTPGGGGKIDVTGVHSLEVAERSALSFPGQFSAGLSQLGNIILVLGILLLGFHLLGLPQSGCHLFLKSPVGGVVLSGRVNVTLGLGGVGGLILVITDHGVRIVHVFQSIFEELVFGGHFSPFVSG